MTRISRRRYLGLGAALAASSLAGCAGGLLREDDSPDEAELRERVRDLETENRRLRTQVERQSEGATRPATGRPTTSRDDLLAELEAERREAERLRRRLENRTETLDALEAEVEAKEARIEELRERISVLKVSGPDSRFEESVREAALDLGERVRESVVYLSVDVDQYSVSHGTGFVLRDDLVVTNSHVVAGASGVECWTLDGERVDVELVGAVDDEDPDVAALRADDSSLPALSAGDSSDLDADQPLVQVGHPGAFGNWVISLGPFVGRPTFRSVGGGTHEALKTDVPSIEGVSGSPLLTLDGEVVGVTYASLPKEYRRRDEAPEPAPAKVYESVERDAYALHETIERVQDQLDEWV